MLITVTQLSARALSYALIGVSVGKRYGVLLVLFEVGLFFIYKLARRDFYYYTNMSGVASIFQRLTIKIIVDNKAFVILSNPCEIGGLYYR
jgi:hypothetical protein